MEHLQLLDQLDRGAMVVLSLAGEPDHDVGGQLGVGVGVAQPCRDAAVSRAAVAAVHRPQDRVAAALQRQVPVGAEARMRGEPGQSRVDVVGVDTAQAQPRVDAAEQGPGQRGQGGARGEIMAPGAQVDAGEDQLGVSGVRGGAGALDHIGEGDAARAAAAGGPDRAVGAAVVAPVLHLEECPRAAGEATGRECGGVAGKRPQPAGDGHDVIGDAVLVGVGEDRVDAGDL